MKFLLESLQIKVNEKIYLKDPESSTLGKNILEHSIDLIDSIGFEAFTFKKLGEAIGSNESSIYRYFENKHKLLIYLTSWYWAWREYKIVLETYEITDPSIKLYKMIDIITSDIKVDDRFTHIDEAKLNNIVINEYSKSFLTKEVDAENKEGYFSIYKRVVSRLANAISAIDPTYPFAISLASTITDGSLHQKFLIEHFPSITDCSKKISPTEYYSHLVKTVLKLEV